VQRLRLLRRRVRLFEREAKSEPKAPLVSTPSERGDLAAPSSRPLRMEARG
jgi:hypothetical protein